MNEQAVVLDPEVFSASFPFSFVVGADGELELVGAGLKRRLEGALSIESAFEILAPARCEGLHEVAAKPGSTVILRVAGSSLELRGQAFYLDAGERYAVIASPVARSLDQIRESGLQLVDFPPSDPTPDLLLSMQATKTALNDARALSSRLEKALHEARSAVAAKSRFLAVMSHEIRTPMNGLGSMVDLLQRSNLRDDQADLVETIDECARTLHVLVDDILDLSRLEANSVQLEARAYEPIGVVQQAARLFHSKADEKGLALEVRSEGAVPECVVGDPHRVRQVLMNLLGNALKFTERGGVQVTLTAPSAGVLEVAVADTGPGIGEAAQASLFKPFTQADSSTTRTHGGTGLGLSISQELARAMGGDVDLVASSPSGSTFRMQVAYADVDASVSAPGADEHIDGDVHGSIEGARVLVAEDNPTNRKIAERLLEKLGVVPTVVDDGVEAVEAVTQGPFDLILMDLMMPNLDGPGAAREIRALDVPWSDLPIVAFTAGAFDRDREVATESGMEGFLEKPVRLDVLRRTLALHLRR